MLGGMKEQGSRRIGLFEAASGEMGDASAELP